MAPYERVFHAAGGDNNIIAQYFHSCVKTAAIDLKTAGQIASIARQPYGNHIRSPERLASHDYALRQMPEIFHFCHRPRCNYLVLALKVNESGA